MVAVSDSLGWFRISLRTQAQTRTVFTQPNSFSFDLVSDTKVLKYLQFRSLNKATDFDGISSCCLNILLFQGIVSDLLKSARVDSL